MDEKEEAKAILRNKYQWSEAAIKAALNPTLRQAKDRGFINWEGEEVNPEQISSLRFLKDEGWEVSKIAKAISKPEAQIAKVLSNRKMLGDFIDEQDK
jgi:hypothetical protein